VIGVPKHKIPEIWMYRVPVDFRKQSNGLIQVVIDELKRQANDGAMYVFRNRGKDKVKILMWDRNGFVLTYKRLEKGRFDFPKKEEEHVVITQEQYEMLISGMPVLHYGRDAEQKIQYE